MKLLDLQDTNLGRHIQVALSLARNLLTGFEQSFDVLAWNNLRSMHLYSNKLKGSPSNSTTSTFLANFTELEILRFEQNKINDVFPSWMGFYFLKLSLGKA
ncbi:hypothetical protein SADUNF_Sadunf16G0110800 [Salix dunnii]|uniref:Uncharacterized protein n=1 Tax=Salix dunnii TaxID=1413687 RepID=A0A835J863_9ROSI|nr:hypothetical protein SADUNF_Sadunf16G0110800 [Salix dunnii]